MLSALFFHIACNSSSFSKVPVTEPNLTTSLRTFQPAVAVRGPGCLLCHAAITGNIITDFAYGEPYFMGAVGGATPGVNFVDTGDNWYGNPANSWQSATIIGQVFIPNANTSLDVKRGQNDPASYYDPASTLLFDSGTSLYTVLTSSYQTGDTPNDGFNTYLTASSSLGLPLPPLPRTDKAMSVGIKVPNSVADQNAGVVEKTSIVIRAPTTLELQGLAAKSQINLSKVTSAQYSIPPSGKTSNLITQGTAPNQVNTQPSSGNLRCYGDVIVNGPLFLNQPTLDTDANGCRIYATGTVFIRGPISYLHSNNGSNLQITSSRAILLGIFYNTDTNSTAHQFYVNRLSSGAIRNSQVRSNLPDYTSISGDTATPPGQVAADGLLGRVFTDAMAVFNTFGAIPDGGEADLYSPPGVTFNHVLLNAPIVQSRYLGNFTGSIIAELALFRLGAFVYFYDTLFNFTPALPALPTKVFSVSDN